MSPKHKHSNAKCFCLYSPSFEDGHSLPTKFTKFGINMSPELCWHGKPDGTKSFALIFDSPSASSDHGKTLVHWMVINIPSSIRVLHEDETMSRIYNTIEICNDFGYESYFGPCPTDDRNHRYRFTLFALSESHIDLQSCLTAEQFRKFMKNIIIDYTRLNARYKRKQEKYLNDDILEEKESTRNKKKDKKNKRNKDDKHKDEKRKNKSEDKKNKNIKSVKMNIDDEDF